MNYQLTCVCSHKFFVTEEQVAKPVTCPACGRTLQPVIHAPIKDPATPAPTPTPAAPTPTDATPATSDGDATKRCPFCGEVILAVAKKCKHCGEFLDRAHPEPTAQNPTAATQQAPSPSDIPPIFSLSVSQWDNFWKFLILFTLDVAVIAGIYLIPQLRKDYLAIGGAGATVLFGFMAWFFYMQVRNSRCYIRPTRIETETGILSKDLTSLELFRITDLDLKQSIMERVLGIGTIRVISNDPQNPTLMLYQIPKARAVYKYLQDQIPVATKQRGAMFIEK